MTSGSGHSCPPQVSSLGLPDVLSKAPGETASTSIPPAQATRAEVVRRNLLSGFEARWGQKIAALNRGTDRFVPSACLADAELGRRGRLIVRFGFLGAFFGTLYAAFYAAIGHYWGALIIVACSVGFGLMPQLMRRSGSLALAGNLLSLILAAGFTALCVVEGGMHGHAIAWLASAPLCALLLVGRKSAGLWMVVNFVAGSAIVALQFAGVEMRPTYDPGWHALVTAAGYLGLIIFMFVLGAIFETGRERAFAKLQDALSKLETSNAELVRLNHEKDEFLGIAAHDLKNPLTVVIGAAEFIPTVKDPAQTNKLAGNIVNAGKRMLHLVTNLLDANAIEQGRFTSQIERCDLQALANECVQNNRATAERKRIRIESASSEPCWIQADRSATLQILDNLISNALKYSPLDTCVRLCTATENEFGLVRVSDQGPGISEDDQKKLFGKFTRLSARPTGGESSNGLGLSIVKRLAEAMSGTVSCQSTPGQGATFVLRLPLAK